MRSLFSLLVILFTGHVGAQDWLAGLSVSQGVNYAFIRKADQQSMLGHSMGVEFFARRHRSLDGIFFEPGVWFGKNTLKARANSDLHVNMQQHALGLSVKSGLLVSKSTYVKVGVLVETVGYAMIEAVNSNGFSLGRSSFADDLHARQFMSGVILGFGGVAGESRIIELFVECHQYFTSPFSEPFSLAALGPSQPPIFNSKALSTVLLGGITFKFVKPRKKIED